MTFVMFGVLIFLIFTSSEIMIQRTVLYIIGTILIVGWAMGYFLWKAGPFIHIMGLLAMVSLLLGLTRKEGID